MMMNVNEIRTICEQVKTPAYIFSYEEFEERARETSRILGPEIGVCYSMKANPFLLGMLPEVFKAVEVCSPGELEICISRGIPAEMIIYSGLNKGEEDIRRALEYGVGLITAESRRHIDMINEISFERHIISPVLVRISAGSQFGIDRKEAAEILESYEDYISISFQGLHFFTGTQKRKAKEIIRELEFLKGYLQEVRERSGLALEKVEYGTGLPAYLFIDKDVSTFDQAVEKERNLLEEVAPYLRELAGHAELTVEMGRFLAASCGNYITSVVDTKTNDGVNYAVVDGGSHQLRYYGQMQGMQVPFIDHVRTVQDNALVGTRMAENVVSGNVNYDTDTNDKKKLDEKVAAAAGNDDSGNTWTLCGSLCTTADVLARNAELPGLECGDTLVFHQTGAYSLYECMSLFLSRDMPRIYLYRDGELTLARDRVDTHILNM